MKFLALDVGRKRIGVASCDRLEMAATPHSVIPANRFAAQAIADLIRREEAEGVVIGLPLSLDGQEREMCEMARSFAEKLAGLVAVPIAMADERLTTKIAEQSLIESGMRREKRKEIRDAVSAALILQSFLDRRRFEKENS
jgi:putative Holliday junction resolvase